MPRFLLVLWLAACAPVVAPPPAPSPTSTAAPTATPSPTPTAASPALSFPIEVLAPGPGSAVTSPIQLRAHLQPGVDRLVRVELFGSQGQLLARYLLRLPAGDAAADLQLSIPFEIRGDQEPARLSLRVDDDFGRLGALASVALDLLAPGAEPAIQPAEQRLPISIEAPQAAVQFAAGAVEVHGRVLAPGNRPLTIYALTRAGRRLAFAEPRSGEPDAEGYALFDTSLDIQVDSPQWIQIVVVANDSAIEGEFAVASLEVFVSP